MLVPRGLGGFTTYKVNAQGFYSTLPHSSLRKWLLSGSLANPSGIRWLAVFLLSWLWYEPGTFSPREILLLSEVQARQERLARRRTARFEDSLLGATLSGALQLTRSHRFAIDLTLDKGEAVVFLTRLGTTDFVLSPRLWKSCLLRYLSLEERRLLVPRFAPESGIDEEHSPKPPRIRGYTDQGSKRPADKWLPPPPPVEDEDPNPNDQTQREIEELWKQQRE